MEKKTRNCYDCVLRFIKNNLLPTLRPEVIITDYETALRDVLASAFPGTRSVGCYFHHNQVRIIIYTHMKYTFFEIAQQTKKTL